MIKSGVIAWSGEVLLPQHPDLLWLGKQRLLIPSELSVCPGSRDQQAEPPCALQREEPKTSPEHRERTLSVLLLQDEPCPPGISRALVSNSGMGRC